MLRKILFLLGPAMFVVCLLLPMGKLPSVVLGTILWMGIWWISEVIPLAITALLPIVIAPMFGVMPAEEISLNYAKSPVFLFLGGFILAKAIEKYNIHKLLAYNILRVFGKSQIGVFVGISLASYILSMWISNTSTTLIMLPMILSLQAGVFLKALGFSAAYSSSIGGMATLVGTPPNLIYAGTLKSFGIDIGFIDWMRFGFPYSVALESIFIFLGILMFKLTFKPVDIKFERVEMDKKGYMVLIIFVITALLWITSSIWTKKFALKFVDDSTIAILSAITLFLMGLVEWKDVSTIPWDALLLFGGGFALSDMIVKGNLSEVIVSVLKGFLGYPDIVFVMLWSILVLILTEFSSNTSIAAMMLPPSYAFATSVGMKGSALAAVVAISASGAFMLPVATPPNMLVYSFKIISMRDMIRFGIFLEIVALILNILITYRFAP